MTTTLTAAPGNAERRRIRDLDEAAFQAAYACDRYTATVLGNRFDYLVEHMSVRLLTGAFSPVLRDFYDLACTISGPPELDYLVPAASNGIVLMAGTTIDAVPNMVEEYGVDRLRPGDVLIANDPYRTGNHNNDLVFVRPVFLDGRIVSFVTLNAHQLDMGGTVPGGFSATKQNVYENGLVLSPRLLVSEGRNVPESWSVIFDNVRMAEILLPDMLTVLSGLELGESLVLESIERYGIDAFLGAMRYSVDAAAEQMALGLAELPRLVRGVGLVGSGALVVVAGIFLGRHDWATAPITTNWATPDQYRAAAALAPPGAVVASPGEIGTLAYYCDCTVVDQFSDRGRIDNLIHDRTAEAGPVFRALLEANYARLRTEAPLRQAYQFVVDPAVQGVPIGTPWHVPSVLGIRPAGAVSGG